jgi:predicted ATPase
MTDRLFGRAHALAALAEAVTAARAGHGRLLLVTGDAGMGKTALAGQLLETAGERGLLVAWAACAAPTGAQPYWPWVQVLRAISAARPVPEPPPPGPAAGGGDRAEARFAFFDVLAGYLARAAAAGPLLVVLDDLHDCDEPSLQALKFVAGQIRTAAVLLLGTYREAEAGPLLRDIARGTPLVPLSGLDEPAIAGLMAGVAGHPPEPAEAHEVWLRTGGNPFFARELTRLGVAEGVPEGISDILRQRLEALPPPCRDLLATAAIAGLEFPVELLARVTGRPGEEVTDLLETAVRHRVLVRPPAPAGTYRFVHDLFRQTVADRLPTADRARRHLAVARVLAGSHDVGVPPARLAAHFAAAGPDAAADAVRYAMLAAAEASDRLADEDACDHLERALAAANLSGAVPAAQRLSVLLDLADARARVARPASARDGYHHAAALARSAGDGAALARAALGLHHLGSRSGTSDAATQALLTEAAESATGDATRALVRAALAREMHHRDPTDIRPTAVAADAVALARRAADPDTLAACLLAAHDAAWRPGTAADRLPILEEMADQARVAGNSHLLAQSAQLRAAALLELGDPAAIGELTAYCRTVEQLHHPRARWNATTRRATLATLADRLDEAQQLIDDALALGAASGEPDAYALAATQSWVLGMLGRPVLLPDAEVGAVYGRPDEPVIRALAAFGRGERDRAERILVGYPLADLPRSHDPEPLIFAAFMFGELGPAAAQDGIYRLLLPLAGTGAAVGGAASFQGPVDLYLGQLAAALGRHDAATRHYRAALAFAQRLGAPAWARVAEQRLHGGNVFRREGAVWRLRYAGRETLIPAGKGLHDLATLLAVPGRECSAGELLGLPAPPAGADPVLDATARAAYQRRLTELAADIDEAEAGRDAGRAERARDEREFLIRELSAAAGLGGRDRRLGDEAEKARKTVTARIRHTIGRIARTHPELAAHLDRSVHTGLWCSYRPDDPTTWHT